MKILIIGGTIFLGRHIAEAALIAGHEVTLFNRGKHNPGLFGERVKNIIGDREKIADLEALTTENYDAVIDTCAYLPTTVSKSAEILKKCCKQYLFISTISVYRDDVKIGITEDYQLAELSPEADATKVTNETYGALKAQCEAALSNHYGAKSLIVRPGYIVGPFDQFDRFNCWVVNAYKNRSPLCPGDGTDFSQFIDVRDLSEWCISLLEQNISGIFNATGETISFLQFVNECSQAAKNKLPVKFISAELIEKDNLWSAFPLFVPAKDEYLGYCCTDISKAKVVGLKFRPYQETLLDIYANYLSKGSDYQLREGITDEVYAKLTNN